MWLLKSCLILLINYSTFIYKEHSQQLVSKSVYAATSCRLTKEINSLSANTIQPAAKLTGNFRPKTYEASNLRSGQPFPDYPDNQPAVKLRFGLIVLLIISGTGYLIYSHKNKKKERKRFWALIRRIKREKEIIIKQAVPDNYTVIAEKPTPKQETAEGANNDINAESTTGKSLQILKETEDKILKQLNKLEKGTAYTQNAISLSSLATKFKTNAKYLSYVINKHKGKDFNNYINDLRVRYIIDKITNDQTYRDYKISYLAEECGFSSHSKFSAAFKKITGLSPSSFIALQQKSDAASI